MDYAVYRLVFMGTPACGVARRPEHKLALVRNSAIGRCKHYSLGRVRLLASVTRGRHAMHILVDGVLVSILHSNSHMRCMFLYNIMGYYCELLICSANVYVIATWTLGCTIGSTLHHYLCLRSWFSASWDYHPILGCILEFAIGFINY